MRRTSSTTFQSRTSIALGLTLVLLAAGLVYVAVRGSLSPEESRTAHGHGEAKSSHESLQAANPRFTPAGNLTLWWDSVPPAKPTTALAGAAASNIHPTDYVGPDACRDCHLENHEAWSGHSHRWMNAIADQATVKGDFDSHRSISYLGGTATFFRSDDGGYRMQLARGRVRRLYRINQTIGSRFFQYYVGKLVGGPEPREHPAYKVDHVLPFGYWLDRQEWAPVVHVGDRGEKPEGMRDDPFATDASQSSFSPYYQCNSCHTTMPLGDQMMRAFWIIGPHAPRKLHWSTFDYLDEAHSRLLGGKDHPTEFSTYEYESIYYAMEAFEAPDHAVTLGVSCEACHLGAKEHALDDEKRPSFFPLSPYLLAEGDSIDTGRTHDNVNWACGRCHTGERPMYAGGMSTWNSTEYSDAVKGSCYSKLTCIDCHEPHSTIGRAWSRTAAEDDASCLRCHDQFQQADALAAHTHHRPDSEGSRCMNCHMPRLNEGLQNVVRTHTIFSPTKAEMIEANHPNACGLCHTDKPIDWTLQRLQAWYGKTYSEEQIAENYPHRREPAIVGWLKSNNEAVRLAATDAVARQQDRSALPTLIDVLDDPFLLNRQFARIALEDWLDVQLADFGYRFYMTPDERREPIDQIRNALLQSNQ